PNRRRRLKSGISTVAPPRSTESWESGMIELHVTASYTSMGGAPLLRRASTKSSITKKSPPPWPAPRANSPRAFHLGCSYSSAYSQADSHLAGCPSLGVPYPGDLSRIQISGSSPSYRGDMYEALVP